MYLLHTRHLRAPQNKPIQKPETVNPKVLFEVILGPMWTKAVQVFVCCPITFTYAEPERATSQETTL